MHFNHRFGCRINARKCIPVFHFSEDCLTFKEEPQECKHFSSDHVNLSSTYIFFQVTPVSHVSIILRGGIESVSNSVHHRGPRPDGAQKRTHALLNPGSLRIKSEHRESLFGQARLLGLVFLLGTLLRIFDEKLAILGLSVVVQFADTTRNPTRVDP